VTVTYPRKQRRLQIATLIGRESVSYGLTAKLVMCERGFNVNHSRSLNKIRGSSAL